MLKSRSGTQTQVAVEQGQNVTRPARPGQQQAAPVLTLWLRVRDPQPQEQRPQSAEQASSPPAPTFWNNERGFGEPPVVNAEPKSATPLWSGYCMR